jgi:hypothetical protein
VRTYTTTTRKTSDSGLCDTLDVVTENLAMSLGSTLAEALATFSACEDASVICFESRDRRLQAKGQVDQRKTRILTSSHD